MGREAQRPATVQLPISVSTPRRKDGGNQESVEKSCGVRDTHPRPSYLYNRVLAQPKSILVTGGAGYIGSHTVKLLLSQGYDVTVVDNLPRGYRRNVDPERLRPVDVTDTESMCQVFAERAFDAVIHFAAFIAVGESMRVPELYFQNNVGGSLSLLTAMIRSGVRRLVFSSTAAVSGMPPAIPTKEEPPYSPVHPYGEWNVIADKPLHLFDHLHRLCPRA